MNASNFDKLDALIMLASKSVIDREAEAFLQTEITVSPSPEFEKKIKRMIQKDKCKKHYAPFRKGLKVLAIACLIALSLLFTACMSISMIRDAIFNAVSEWYDDFVLIYFKPSEQTQQPTTEPEPAPSQPEETIPPPPTETTPPPQTVTQPTPHKTIEYVNAPTKIPHGYTVMSYVEKRSHYQEYYTENGDFAFFFNQNPRKDQLKVDTPDAEIIPLKIGEFDALLVIGMQGDLSVVWSDEYYSYMINEFYGTQEELLEIANSVPRIQISTES